jgi:hypothetical protein
MQVKPNNTAAPHLLLQCNAELQLQLKRICAGAAAGAAAAAAAHTTNCAARHSL